MKLIIAIFILSFTAVNGQILDNSSCEAFTDEPFFNINFIKENKVKSIHGEISTKKKLSSIKTRGLITHYDFDENGILTQQYQTTLKSASLVDTTIVTYLYDDKNQLITKRRNDSYGFYSYNYTYDSTGQIASEKYCRDENANESKSDFKLGKQFVIVSENYENEWVSAKELRRKYFNNYGRPYQELVFRWDDRGYLIEEETTLLLNSKKNKTSYSYNEKGLVLKKEQSSNVTGNSTLVHEYEYDEVGNLINIDEYRNGQHITKREIIYNANMLMDAIIIMDVATEYMSIIRYKYNFYE